MGNAVKSQGSTIAWYNGTSYVTIGEVTSIGGPSMTSEAMDSTDIGDSVRSFASSGLYDGGEVSVEWAYYPSDTAQDSMETDFKAGTARNCRIPTAAASSTTYTFNAIITAYQPVSASVGEKVTGSAMLKVNGAVTKA